MAYVIRRKEDGKYVARPGLKHSFTRSLAAARKFETAAHAESECCGDEYCTKV